MTLQTEILPTVASDFLKQMIILKAFNSVLHVFKRKKIYAVGWLVVLGLTALWDSTTAYFNLYRAVSQREGERREK